jgi:hypothetical protein
MDRILLSLTVLTMKTPRSLPHRPSIVFTTGPTSTIDLSGIKTYTTSQKALAHNKRTPSPQADPNQITALFNPTIRS